MMNSFKMAFSVLFFIVTSSLLTKAVMIDLNRSPPLSPGEFAHEAIINHQDKQQSERLPLEVTRAETQTPKRKRTKDNRKRQYKALEQGGIEDTSTSLAPSTKKRKRMIAKMTEEEREKYFDRKRMYEKGQRKARKERGKDAQDTERRRQRIAKMTKEKREEYMKHKREKEKQQYQNRKALLGYGRKSNQIVKNIRLKIKQGQATSAEIAQVEKIRLYEAQKYQKKKAKQEMTNGKS